MKILMVCLGNICRSPLADGLLRAKVEREGLDVTVDSAGTSGHHVGESPDRRMQATAEENGYPIDFLRARQFSKNDFQEFDLIYAMDRSNYNNILDLAESDEDRRKVKMILNESHPNKNLEVPDPYYGGEAGFKHVFELLDAATDVIIDNLKK